MKYKVKLDGGFEFLWDEINIKNEEKKENESNAALWFCLCRRQPPADVFSFWAVITPAVDINGLLMVLRTCPEEDTTVLMRYQSEESWHRFFFFQIRRPRSQNATFSPFFFKGCTCKNLHRYRKRFFNFVGKIYPLKMWGNFATSTSNKKRNLY